MSRCRICGGSVDSKAAYQLTDVDYFFCSNACARIFVNGNYGKTPGVSSMAKLKHYDFVSAYPVPGAQSLVPGAQSLAPSTQNPAPSTEAPSTENPAPSTENLAPGAENPAPPRESRDLAKMVFATDPRVLQHARLRFECEGPSPEENIKRLREAVSRLWDLGLSGHEPEVVWYREAVTLGERVGRPWHETPQPTLVEALSRDMKEQLWPLGFRETKAPSGATVQIEAYPQLEFRGQRFVLNDAAALAMVIEDIKVGNQSCMVSSSPMPASLFGASAFPMRLCMPTCHISMRISFQLRNDTESSVFIKAVLLGRVPEARPLPVRAFFVERNAPKEKVYEMVPNCDCRKRRVTSSDYGARWDGHEWHDFDCNQEGVL